MIGRPQVSRAAAWALAWTALAALICNDHLLKGSALLPDLVTGKLSDVAGLFVVPTALAIGLRLLLPGPVPQRVLGAFAIAAVTSVFVAIQHPLGAAWTAEALSTLGVSWRIWPDPTDLLALPALPLGWWLLAPCRQVAGGGVWGRRSRARRTPRRPLGRRPRGLGTLAFVVVAGLASIATSNRPPDEPDNPTPPAPEVLDDARARLDAPACVEWIAAIDAQCDATPTTFECRDPVRDLHRLLKRVGGDPDDEATKALAPETIARACEAGLSELRNDDDAAE